MCESQIWYTGRRGSAEKNAVGTTNTLHAHKWDVPSVWARLFLCLRLTTTEQFLIGHFNWLTHSQLETIFLISKEINDLILNLCHTFILASLWHWVAVFKCACAVFVYWTTELAQETAVVSDVTPRSVYSSICLPCGEILELQAGCRWWTAFLSLTSVCKLWRDSIILEKQRSLISFHLNSFTAWRADCQRVTFKCILHSSTRESKKKTNPESGLSGLQHDWTIKRWLWKHKKLMFHYQLAPQTLSICQNYVPDVRIKAGVSFIKNVFT